MTDRVSEELRKKVRRWSNVIRYNQNFIPSVRKPAVDEIINEMRKFVKEDNITVIFYNDTKLEPCPKCDYERGRIYQWLGRWYFMCHNCALGIPEPALVDWGKYGDLNKEDAEK